MKLIRVFPRKTVATPDDENVRFDVPGMFDEADEVHVSVAFTWDIPDAEELAEQWRAVTDNVLVGGPAYGDPGGEFVPGMYIKRGYTMTSRGCPNHCWFCRAWKNEGTIRELPIEEGWNVLDNNLLACSREHQDKVFTMLAFQEQDARFTGGFEAARFTSWHVDWMKILMPKVIFFAYDTPDDFEPLVNAAKLLREAELFTGKHAMRCYVLTGYRGDTIEAAEKRLNDTMALGFMPMSMLYDGGAEQENRREWRRFHRTWANTTIIGARMKQTK